MKRLRNVLTGTAVAALISGAAWSDELNIGTGAIYTSLDPHFWNSPENNSITAHFFERLVHRDHNEDLLPGLAVSWKPVDDKTWEVKLREGVTWHDGSPFTADDAVFTVERANAGIPGSTTSSSRYILNKDFKAVDDHTLHVVTETPYPLMARDLSASQIVSRKHGEGASTADYDSKKAAIGTGPFKVAEWVRDDRLVLDANPDWWGGKTPWVRVIFRTIPSPPSRLAALLSGSVDFIDTVPTEDVETLRKNDKVTVHAGPSNRLQYIWIDFGRDSTPWAKTKGGEPLWPNPLRDWRVRKAIDLAIDREALVERVMGGMAVPAGQTMPPGSHGHDPSIKPTQTDPARAKQLLAEAGFPDGFQIRLHSTKDRFPNDALYFEAIAQMLTRVGIKTDLEALPSNVYWSKAAKGDFSLFLGSWGSDTGDGSNTLFGAVHTTWPGTPFGAANRGKYSNRNLDDIIQKINVEMDEKNRSRLIYDANRLVNKDVAIVNLFWQMGIWASRPDLTYNARKDEWTAAWLVGKK